MSQYNLPSIKKTILSHKEKQKQTHIDVNNVDCQVEESNFPMHNEIVKIAYGIANINKYKLIRGMLKYWRRIFLPSMCFNLSSFKFSPPFVIV